MDFQAFQEKVRFWLGKRGTQKVLINFTWLGVFRIVEKVVPLITIPYLLRVIGMEKWGLITFAQSFIQYFNTFVDYGFNVTAVREVSLHQEKRDALEEIFSRVMLIKLFFLLIGFVIFFFLVMGIKRFYQEKEVFLLTFGLVVGQTLFPLWFFQGMEKMKFSTILSSVAKIVFLILIFALVKTEKDYVYVPILNSIGIILAGIIGLLIVRFGFHIRFRMPSWIHVIKTMKEGGKVFISNLFISFYANTRVFALGIFSNNTIVGYYGLAEKIVTYLGMPSELFGQAMYPRLANLYGTNKKQFVKLLKYLNLGMFVWGGLVCVFGFLFSPFIVEILTGKSITYEITFTLFFLLLAAFFVQANTFRIQYFLAAARYGLYTFLHVAVGFIGIVLTLFFSYFFEYKGTAIAVSLVEGMVFLFSGIMYSFSVKEETDEK